MTDPERSKQTVIAYLDTAFNDKQPAEAVENYGGSHYIQHNPQAPDGFDFIQFVEGFVEQFPQLSLDIAHHQGGPGRDPQPAKGLTRGPRLCGSGHLPLGGRQGCRALGCSAART